MKHYNRIFNILYFICMCLTLTAIAKSLLYRQSIPAIASLDPPPAEINSFDIRRVALTFDDGPHPVYTEKLLDGLKERGVKATFSSLVNTQNFIQKSSKECMMKDI